jgi:hypothetical protein
MLRCATLLFVCSTLLATVLSSAGARPTLLALDGPPGAGRPTQVVRFAGQPAHLSAVFLTEPGERPTIFAEVYVDGSALAAPLAKDLKFTPANVQSHPALLEGDFILPLPAEGKSALLRVLIFTSEPPPQLPAKVAEFAVRLVDAEALPKSLAAWLNEAGIQPERRLALHGRLPGLRDLLESWHVHFESLEEPPRKTERNTLFIDEPSDEEAAAPRELADGASCLLLQHRPEALFDRVQKSADGRLWTQVNRPPAGNWAESASLQQFLLQHIQQLHSPND